MPVFVRVRQIAYAATVRTPATRLAFAIIARAIMDAAGLIDCSGGREESRQRIQSKALRWLSQETIDQALDP